LEYYVVLVAETARITVAHIVGVIVGIAGPVFLFVYGPHALESFSNPNVSFTNALLDVVITWGLGLAAVFMAFRFLREGSSKRKSAHLQDKS
jgi:hypothetical protein